MQKANIKSCNLIFLLLQYDCIAPLDKLVKSLPFHGKEYRFEPCAEYNLNTVKCLLKQLTMTTEETVILKSISEINKEIAEIKRKSIDETGKKYRILLN